MSGSKRKHRVSLSFCEAVEPRLLLSVASSTFATPNTVAVPGAEAPLVTGSFSGTGNPIGIAVATPTTVQILDGSSTGVFTLGASIPLPANPAAISPFEVGNFTGSQAGDIVLDSYDSSNGDGVLTYETNNGDGTFSDTNSTNIANGEAGFRPIAGRATDFNGDGETDLAIIGKPNAGDELVLAVMTSNGDGTFSENDIPITGSNAAGNISNEQVITTVTNEIIVYDGSSGNLDVFSGTGDGNFTQLTPVPMAASLVVSGTFNSDQDLIVANGSQVSLLVNQGDGTFQPDTQGPITLGGTVDALAVGDFNLDGNADILTNQGILFGNGDETFNTTAEALPASINGGGNVANTAQAINILGNGRLGFAGFSASGNAIVTAVNQTLVGVSIDLESTNNPANPGADIQFTAGVSSADSNITATPTGSVTFMNGAAVIGSAPLVDGTATFDAGSSLPSGASSITAVYGGDTKFAANTSAVFTQTVLSPTTTSVMSSENPSLTGDDVMLTATVIGTDGAGDTPSGNVEFFDNGTDLGGGDIDSGTATFDTTGSLAVGSHSITAQYQGDSNFGTSTSTAITQAVNPPSLLPVVASTTLPTAIVSGTAVHGTVTVTLTNQTSSPLLISAINIFASTNGSALNAASVASLTSKRGFALKAGQTKSMKVTVKAFPTTLASGTYHLLATVVSSLSVTSNSVPGPALTVAAPFVQLTSPSNGTAIVKPASIKAGKSVTFTFELINSGNIITPNATINIGLSTDGATESTPLVVATNKLRIKPGKSSKVSIHVKIPLTATAGSYDPFVSVMDDGDTVTIIGTGIVVEG